jgi:hypothetical protein
MSESDSSEASTQVTTKKTSRRHSCKVNRQNKIKLAALWREHKELWDVRDENYHDRDKKELAYLAIAKEMAIAVDVVKTTMHSLRTQYGNERRREKAYIPTGTGNLATSRR